MDNTYGRSTEATHASTSNSNTQPKATDLVEATTYNELPENSSSFARPADLNSDLQLPQQFTWPPIRAFALPEFEHTQIPHQQLPAPAHTEGRPAAGATLSLRSPPAVNSESSGREAPKATATLTRTRVTDGQRLQMVRLCCLSGEEFLGPKEDFWAKRTIEFN